MTSINGISYRVTAGNEGVNIPTYNRNAHHGTLVVEVHNLNEILKLIVVLRMNQSSDLTTAALS